MFWWPVVLKLKKLWFYIKWIKVNYFHPVKSRKFDGYSITSNHSNKFWTIRDFFFLDERQTIILILKCPGFNIRFICILILSDDVEYFWFSLRINLNLEAVNNNLSVFDLRLECIQCTYRALGSVRKMVKF